MVLDRELETLQITPFSDCKDNNVIIGNFSECAIQFEIASFPGERIFGSFILWLNHASVGDPTDTSVDLKACRSWLIDFLERPRDRVEPEVYALDKGRVFELLADSVLNRNPVPTDSKY